MRLVCAQQLHHRLAKPAEYPSHQAGAGRQRLAMGLLRVCGWELWSDVPSGRVAGVTLRPNGRFGLESSDVA
jgi:hypothetical protein